MKKQLGKLAMLAIAGLSNLVNGQVPSWVWAKGFGGTVNDGGLAMTVDPAGNILTTGFFKGTVDFDPGPGIFNLTSTGTNNDMFISKMDNNGNFIWAKRIGGSGDVSGWAIALDATGNIYTTGDFVGTIDFDPGPSSYYLTSSSYTCMFISKLDPSGNNIWAKAMIGTGSANMHCQTIAIDASENVYTTGSFSGIVDFDPGVGVFNLPNSGCFVSKLNASGNFVWAKGISGTSAVVGNAISLDASANVFYTGFFQSTADFDPGAGIFNLTANTYEDIFISKLDSSGNLIWAKRMSGSSNSRGYGVVVDHSGNIYSCGYFYGTGDFDPDTSSVFDLSANGHWDIYVTKFTNTGNFLWAKGVGGSDYDQGLAIAVDASNNVFITGSFQGTVDFNPDTTGSSILTTPNGVFVLNLDSMGNYLWAQGSSGTAGDKQGRSIAVDLSGNCFVTGYFKSPSVIFGSFTLTNAPSNNKDDIFIAKLDHITGIESYGHNNSVSVYPNPATDYCTISIEGQHKKVTLNISDITGKLIYSTIKANPTKIEVNTKKFRDGIFIIQIQTGEYIETKKLIISKK